MRVNDLIIWLSARGQGSWEQFKAAVETLHLPDDVAAGAEPPEEDSRQSGLPLHQELRLMLERLGHAEFFARGCEQGWRVAPPVWASQGTNEPPSAILCGARTLPLLDRVRSASVAPAVLESDENPVAPNVYRLKAFTSDVLLSTAAATGVPVCFDASRAMLCALRPVREMYEEVTELPLGRDWVVEQFDSQSLRWRPSSREEGCAASGGLFRFRLSYQRRHFLRQRGQNHEMEGAAAKYAWLRRRRRRVFRHISASRECVIPASCRPPMLIERALILCSGRLPTFQGANATLTYRNVSADIARLAALLLDQKTLP